MGRRGVVCARYWCPVTAQPGPALCRCDKSWSSERTREAERPQPLLRLQRSEAIVAAPPPEAPGVEGACRGVSGGSLCVMLVCSREGGS